MRSSPYFVRCIKPNKNKIPNNWNEEMIEQQLLYTGVLETIKIRRDGFAIRMKFEEFIEVRLPPFIPIAHFCNILVLKQLPSLKSCRGITV